MAYASLNDLLQVEPTITDYGVLEWDTELSRSETEVNRILQVRWFQQYRNRQGQDLTFDPTLLTSTQWKQATVYHALAFHISPKLTKFEPETDKFQVMMEYYAKRFESEMDLCLRLGVEYDLDDSGTVSVSEKQSLQALRLRR
jgi:hypothetical protein